MMAWHAKKACFVTPSLGADSCLFCHLWWSSLLTKLCLGPNCQRLGNLFVLHNFCHLVLLMLHLRDTLFVNCHAKHWLFVQRNPVQKFKYNIELPEACSTECIALESS